MEPQRSPLALRLLRNLRCSKQARKPPLRHLIASRRSFHGAQGRREEQRADFRGQVYESAYRRVERERAEQRRFAEQRGEGRYSSAPAITFGLLFSELLAPCTDSLK